LATAISAIVAEADYGKTSVNIQPNGELTTFNIGAVSSGTTAVYLNGLLQFAGVDGDYVEVLGSGPQAGMTVQITFSAAPRSGSRIQVLGNVI
jgi:hypothetical protein